MRRTLLHTTLLLAVSSVSALSGAAPNAIQWAKSFDAALAEAKRTNKLVMADFYTDW